MHTDSEYWSRIRQFYASHSQEFATSRRDRWAIDPYAWSFEAGIVMSPIEDLLWFDIRSEGVILYPQYPIGPYFADFGNPSAKVAIECDGEAYHRNRERDAIRQRFIEDVGWSVYRLTGRQCCTQDRYTDDEDGTRIDIGPARKMLREICLKHGISVKGTPVHEVA